MIMNCSKCGICRCNDADKTNSHLIPSFFITRVSSSNGSGKRGTEILFNVGRNVTTVYLGDHPSCKAIEETFDNITDERIVELKSNNKVARDYIFCSDCERKLGTLLESPYSAFIYQNNKISVEIPYFFWLSVIWRISKYNIIRTAKLKKFHEASLRNRLYGYFQTKNNGTDISHLLLNQPFKYRMLYCKDYNKARAGMVYGMYNSKNKTLSCCFGDIFICFYFGNATLSNYTFYGFEKYVVNAPLNDGTFIEQHLDISNEVMDHSMALLIKVVQKWKIEAKCQQVIKLWPIYRKMFPSIAPTPNRLFFSTFIYHLSRDNDKVGDMLTPEHYAQALANTFKDIYNISDNILAYVTKQE